MEINLINSDVLDLSKTDFINFFEGPIAICPCN